MIRLRPGSVVKSNPLYRLVRAIELTGQEMATARAAGFTSSDYGLFVPLHTAYTVKVADQATANLFEALLEPKILNSILTLNEDALADIARLALDGILEVLLDGRFATGPALLANDTVTLPFTNETVTTAALRYIDQIPVDDVVSLSARLYNFNRLPFNSISLSYGHPKNKVRDFVFGGRDPRTLGSGWIENPPDSAQLGDWHRFLNTRRPPTRTYADGWTCKLYIAVQWQDLPAAVSSILESTLAAGCVTGFKFPSDIFGLHRPDKLVLYVISRESVTALARELHSSLKGLKAHAVPFTEPLDDEGLFSWGADPPRAAPGSEFNESWRLWLVRRIAGLLVHSRRLGHASRGINFALQRLALDRIDTERWAPISMFEA